MTNWHFVTLEELNIDLVRSKETAVILHCFNELSRASSVLLFHFTPTPTRPRWEFPTRYVGINEKAMLTISCFLRVYIYHEAQNWNTEIPNEIQYSGISVLPPVLSGTKIQNTISIPMPMLNGWYRITFYGIFEFSAPTKSIHNITTTLKTKMIPFLYVPKFPYYPCRLCL